MRASWLVVVPLLAMTALPAQAATVRVVTVGSTFLPSEVAVARGDTFELTNLDVLPHNVTSVARTRRGALLFSSATIDAGKTAPIRGLSALKPGSYAFLCTLHPRMRGLLIVR